MSRIRLNEIDVATGIAITLVVTGHLQDSNPNWYDVYKNTLYKFHMPFFMFISGFLLAYTNNNYSNFNNYLKFLKSKIFKFVIPYLFMSFLFLIVKILINEYSFNHEIKEAIKDIIFSPISGPSGFMWYIYVLFQYYIFFPLVYQFNFFKKYFFIFIIIGLILSWYNPFTYIFQLSLFAKYFLFFSIGFYLALNYQVFYKILNKLGWIFLVVFMGLFFYDLINYKGVSNFLLAITSLPAILYVAIKINKNRLIEEIGKKTFTIYLWNSAFIFGLTYVLSFIDNVYLEHYFYYAPFIFVIGIFGPLLLRKFTRSNKIGFIAKYIIP